MASVLHGSARTTPCLRWPRHAITGIRRNRIARMQGFSVADDSAIDVGIFDGSLITVDRSLVPKDGDAVVVDVNGERSIKIFKITGGRSSLAFGNRRYPTMTLARMPRPTSSAS